MVDPNPDERAGIQPAALERDPAAQRSGTATGAEPNAVDAGRPDAPAPTTERPVDQAGPVGEDGAQHPPGDRSADAAEWERAAQGDVEPPPDERPDPRVSSIPLDTEDGDQVVISQQNAGPGQHVGAGEFKEPGRTSAHKDPAEADREQQRLDREAHADASADSPTDRAVTPGGASGTPDRGV